MGLMMILVFYLDEEEEKQSGNEQPRQVSIYDIEDEYYTPDKPNETQPKETYAYTFSTVDKKVDIYKKTKL